LKGAFDPILKISAVAKKYNCWLHVDGSWGGSVVFSEKVMREKDWLVGSHLVKLEIFWYGAATLIQC
jgi:glutamate decarboxylase